MVDIPETITLISGRQMPRIGLGVWRAGAGDETYRAVRAALDAGYRHIDTAMIYGNEESVGAAVRDSGVPREKLFITTKLWNDDVVAGRARAACVESLQRLGMDYVDLYLIHWPAEGYVRAWSDLEKLHADGLARTIGVSNFNAEHLEAIERTALVEPAVNQIESHPGFDNQAVVDWCQMRGIVVTAWKPLGGGKGAASLLADPAIADIAAAIGRTPAQVVLRWHLQRGVAVIPKSVHEARIRANLAVFDFRLTDDQMAAISALECGNRLGRNPADFPA
jgi:diketogulonate reductase-like aldo/keto reductase